MLQSGGGVRGKAEKKNEGNERNEVSGLVWCKEAKGSENVRYRMRQVPGSQQYRVRRILRV